MIPLSLRYEDGTVEDMVCRPFAVELWERHTKQKAHVLADGSGVGDMLRIAYEEKRLADPHMPKYDDWAKTIVNINEVAAPPKD
jgi:hypothetical protein